MERLYIIILMMRKRFSKKFNLNLFIELINKYIKI